MSNSSRYRLVLGCVVLLWVSFAFAGAQEPTPGWNTPWRNADGSLKLAIELGGGINRTAGAARSFQGAGWNYRIGGGYRLNRRIAALIEYNYDRFSVPQSATALLNLSSGANSANVHLWSFTLEPTLQYFSTERVGGYLIGGGGFYRKIVVSKFICPYGENCGLAFADSRNIFSNNAGGANFGTGIAWRVWDHSNTKVFLEARYVWVDNTRSPNPAAFPTRTGYFPATAGVRW